MSKRKTVFLFVNLIMLAFTLCACSKDIGLNLAETTSKESQTYEVPSPMAYDSEGIAIVTNISDVNKTITLYDYELQKSYTLEYDGISCMYDKYKTPISISQVKLGSLVDVLFLKSKKHLVTLTEASNSFTLDSVTDFSVNTGAKVFSYKSEAYKITDGTILLSKSGQLSFADLNAVDKVTLVGVDSTIYSITVDEGHGYLSVKGAANLTGGFMEIGSKQIERITDPMLITIKEGSYDIKITAKGVNETRKVSVLADKETVLDLSDIEIDEVKTGRVLFNVTPDTAVMYIDGKSVDHADLIPLEYGIHQVNVSAPGYDSITRYVNVKEETATLSIILDEKAKTTEETKKEEETKQATDGFYIYITTPSNVEVYIDNIYIGLSPIVVKKTEGNHIVTLRKSGYVTRSYTLSIQNEEGDVTYSFEDLVPSSLTENEDEKKDE